VKTLLILRHAKASPDSPSGRDLDRPLTGRGHRACAAVGRDIQASGRRIDAIVASPAARVVETVAGAVEGAGWALEPAWDRRLYNAPRDALLEVIGEVDDAVEALLIVGHNPGLQELILHLAEDDRAGLHAQVGASFPTATLAELRLPINRWADAGPGCGRIMRLFRPRDRDESSVGPG
jgi:phosphohistidine phosphatase